MDLNSESTPLLDKPSLAYNAAARRLFFRNFSVFQHSSSQDQLHNLSHPKETKSQFVQTIEAVIYGIVNSILTIPCMYGYAAIIFRNPQFEDEIQSLAKLVLFSSAVHQLVFRQVQDAGLIFLSTMASNIARHAQHKENILSTTLFTLSLSTFLLGVVVWTLGRLKLASLVSYLPMPVISGYLGFIGFFCFQAGLNLSTGQDVSSITQFAEYFQFSLFKFIFPAILSGWALFYVNEHSKAWWHLPSLMIAIPALFYVYMLLDGLSLDEARQEGWMQSSTLSGENSGLLSLFQKFSFDKVEIKLVFGQFFTWLSMTFVVSFSSCLDVVAIEMDMRKQLNIAHELETVGLSNIISGLLGGYTGSYIFSQTVFTYRTKVNSRIVGYTVVIFELLFVFLPIDLMTIIPKYFFAGTLIFCAILLFMEYLVHIYYKVSLTEYFVLFGTFAVITLTDNLIQGILIGVGFAICNFIAAYSSVRHVEKISKKKSNVVRSFEDQQILEDLDVPSRLRIYALHGYLFFGSSLQIVNKIRKELLEAENNHLLNLGDFGTFRDSNSSPMCVILDLTRVTGMDSTAISTGLLQLKQLLSNRETPIRILYCNVRPDFEALLVENNIIENENTVFNSLNDAFGHAETTLITNYKDTRELEELYEEYGGFNLDSVPFLSERITNSAKSLSQFSGLSQLLLNILFSGLPLNREEEVKKSIVEYFEVLQLYPGDLVFDYEDEAKYLVILAKGEVVTCLPKTFERFETMKAKLLKRQSFTSLNKFHSDSSTTLLEMGISKQRSNTHLSAFDNNNFLDFSKSKQNEDILQDPSLTENMKVFIKLFLDNQLAVLQRWKAGSFVGSGSFTLNIKRKFCCLATEESTIFILRRENLNKIKRKDPQMAIALTELLLKSVASSRI
eukprot:snap_masked-scaffold_22-processed-gene-2.12-mRNA-1 protein AED:0.10 eAED:0.16 QI:0/0/0/1/1/1/2/0/898